MTDLSTIRASLLACFDELGILVDNPEDDFDMAEYIPDSLTFISFIVGLEQCLSIEIPETLMLAGKMASFNAYCETINAVVNGMYEESEGVA